MQRSKPAGAAPSKGTTQDASGAFVELTRVTLTSPVLSEEGQVPAGATGTVVYVWHTGTACEVEFTRPFRALATATSTCA